MKQPAVTTSAKVAPGCVRTPGLFLHSASSLAKQKLDARKERDGLVFHFWGDCQLNEDDVAVLLVVIAIAQVQNDTFRLVRQYIGEKDMRARKMNSKTIEVTTSYSALLRELGMSNNGGTWLRVRESLKRLSGVSAKFYPQGASLSPRYFENQLVSAEALEGDTGKDRVRLRLCPLLAAGLLGGPGEFVQIRLDGFRALRDKSGVAQLLYFHLHHFSTHPHSQSEDYFLKQIYGEDFGTGSTLSMRRKRLKEAFEKIRNLEGWFVEDRKGGYSFKRPECRKMERARMRLQSA